MARSRRPARAIALAMLVLSAIGPAVTGCASSAPSQAPTTATVTVSAPAPTSPVATRTVTATAAPNTVDTQAPRQTTQAPAPPPQQQAPPPTQVQPPPPAPAQPAPAQPTTAAAPAGGCSIRSNEGTCYKAGEFCRHTDLGATTTDDGGRTIHCVETSAGGQPHWEY